jgi:hypothetical protein
MKTQESNATSTHLFIVASIGLMLGAILMPALAFAADPSYGRTKRIGGTNSELGYSVSVDSSGNTYLTGTFAGTANFAKDFGGVDAKSSVTGSNVFVTRINADGTYGWTKRIGGNYGFGVSVDSSGNIYVTGFFNGGGGTVDFAADFGGSDGKISAGSNDIFVTRINANGTYGWTKRMGGTSSDESLGVSIDANGNVYVVGYFQGTVNFAADFGGSDSKTSAGVQDIFVTRINSNGTYEWTKRMGGTSNDYGYGVSIDPSGNVYVTGYFSSTVNFAADFGGNDSKTPVSLGTFVTRINTNGTYGWTKIFDKSDGYAVSVDSSENVYVTGTFGGGAGSTVNFARDFGGSNIKACAGGNDIFVTRINQDGSYGWTKRMGGTNGETPHGVSVDSSGNVYMTGVFNGTVNFASDFGGSDSKISAGVQDIFITRINANGTYGWTKRMGGTNTDQGLGIFVDANGTAYITGSFSNTVNFAVDFGGIDSKTAASYDIFVTTINVPDADDDGLPDAVEKPSSCPNRNNPDSDGDGLCDGILTVPGVCMAGEDLDVDGVVDAGESDPCNPDSDGDGHNDGSDCAKLDPRHWSDCGVCVDTDDDGYGTNCNLGPDCSDTNTFTWNTCATCNDVDSDTWYELCGRYTGTPSATTIGTGTGEWSYPLSTSYHDNRTQVIYLASELGPARRITAVALDGTSVPGQPMNNFTIRMKHTALISYATNSWEGPGSGWTTVYQANETIAATGWHTFTLTTPFNYNGTSNLMVDFSFNNSTATTTGYVHFTSGSANRTLYYYTNSAYGDPLSWSGTSSPMPNATSNFPNLRLTLIAYINGPDCDDNESTGASCHNTCSNFYQDSDSDGYGNASVSANRCIAPAGYVVSSTDCNDGSSVVYPLAPEVCDGIDNQCSGDPGYGQVDEGCGAAPWDTDTDFLPNDYETAHAGDTPPLDPNNALDGAADFDGDGNSNVNEYWNGSDPWTIDPTPGQFENPGCYYWADADGDGNPAPSDLVLLKLQIAGAAQEYRDILPHGIDTLDLDRDGNAAPSDQVLLKLIVAMSERLGGYPSQALSLETVDAPSGSVAVGSTTHVTVSVHSVTGDPAYAPGFGVVFEVVSGNAVLLGGDGTANGEAAGNRYDFSMEAAAGAKANIVVLVTGSGPITIGAKIPECGAYPNGRWNDEVLLNSAVVINP